ncbi:unnamed protein product [Acanthoscelides obtectus]|uniref:Uncharacterized protein n=1 Tax=Acanthoscelides obtectus TaxID=200917 RepID=A0A9P0PA56_ACAOB|nr:unnamed protein product [Acanthoscelides obtectus]CAK1656935.1 hypothetical protein AOBTE_LOCUS20028 [Acanthoscelides obtectus]
MDELKKPTDGKNDNEKSSKRGKGGSTLVLLQGIRKLAMPSRSFSDETQNPAFIDVNANLTNISTNNS